MSASMAGRPAKAASRPPGEAEGYTAGYGAGFAAGAASAAPSYNAVILVAAGHVGAGGLVRLALVLAAIAVIYAVVVLVRPVGRCPRCHGRRVIVRRARPRSFARCEGHGRVPRPGAKAIHRFFWSVLGDQLRERRRTSHTRDGD
jgi:hypothetical protein